MEDILMNVLYAALTAGVVYVCNLIRKKWSPSAVGTLQAIVPIAVKAVEQIAKGSKEKGYKKLEKALNIVEETFEAEMSRPLKDKETGIAEYLIEAAVKELFPKGKK